MSKAEFGETPSAGLGSDPTEPLTLRDMHEAMARLSQVFRDARSVGELSFAAGEAVGMTLRASRVGFGTLDAETDTLFVDRDWTMPDVVTLQGTTPLRQFGSYMDDWKTGRTVVIDDVYEDPRTAPGAKALDELSARSFVGVPVLENDLLVAVVYVNSDHSRRWTDEELFFAKEVAERTRTAVERARSEQALRDLNASLEERATIALTERKVFSDVIEGSTASVTALDLDFRILAINRANVETFDSVYGRRPAVGDRLLELFEADSDHRLQLHQNWSRALAGEEFVTVQAFGDPGLDRRHYEVRFSILRDLTGHVIGASSTSYDVTERVRAEEQLKAAQEQLRQSQKMEAMGQLTGGVAHDFNNLLTPIIGGLDMLVRRQVGTERERRLIDGALQSAERAKILVQRLLAFARRQPLQAVPVDLRHLVTNMADLVDSTSGPHVEVRVDIGQDLPSAVADPNQLEMALLNLAVNARDAMPDGGVLTISARLHAVDPSGPDHLCAGSYVRLQVADTGTGMDEATLARATEPFFSTKGIGKGTGLGLSMVHGLAAQLGGELLIESATGLGTTISLFLPVSPDEPMVEAQPHPQTSPRAGRGTVLLVDDEAMVRMSTADMLLDMGFEVVEAASASEALDMVASGLQPDLLITDHLMPGMDGSDLAREMLAKQATTPILIISGYADADGVDPSLARLTKPFRNNELADKLRALGAL